MKVFLDTNVILENFLEREEDGCITCGHRLVNL